MPSEKILEQMPRCNINDSGRLFSLGMLRMRGVPALAQHFFLSPKQMSGLLSISFLLKDCPTTYRCRAFTGHAWIQFMHKIHSVPWSRPRELSNISTSMGQTFLHFPQPTHFSLSCLIRSSEK